MPALILLLLVAVWWLSGPSSDETIVYNAVCANKITILPLSIISAQTNPIEKAFKKHQYAEENCQIFPISETTYKLNEALGEVYYLSLFGSKRLVDCSIFSRTDWSCSYPDGSGEIVIIDGLRAVHRDEVKNYQFSSFSLRRWQWWIAKIWAWIDDSPQGAWLIPDQHEHL